VAPPVDAGSRAPSEPALIVGNGGPGAFTVRATRGIQVTTVARLERRNADGSCVPDPVAENTPGYLLSESCVASPPPACRSLAAGETLAPVAWSGDTCAGQCEKPCWPYQYQSGTHRLVVSSCATPPQRFEGPAFEMPATIQALARLRLASAVAHVRAARVDAGGLELGPAAAADSHIAGLKEIKGTSKELGAELTSELLQWLRAKDGFNDLVAKRCPPTVAVGFVLSGEFATTRGPAQRTDLSVDVGCMSLDIVQNGEELSFSYFDPSEPQFLSILSRIFPGDRELTRFIDRQLEARAKALKPRAQPNAH